MSAFFDIWISNSDAPKHNRITNKQWQNNKPGCYHSHPNLASFKSYTEHIYNNTVLTILGQFYEQVDIDVLTKNCINHIENGSKFDDPAGHYLLIVKDNERETTHFFTSRLGTYHAYWCNSNGQNIVSTYYLAIAKQLQDKQLNWEALSSFFAVGYFPGQETYLTGINIMLPASCYSFDADLNLKKQYRYWDWQYTPISTDHKETFAVLDETLRSSLCFATNNKRVALPISGGLDSRMLAGIINKSNCKSDNIWAYSYGYSKQSQEIKIAAQVAATYNILFESYTVPNYLFKELDHITDAVELFQYIDGTRQASIRDLLEKKADVVIGGHWGDVWMNNFDLGNGSEEEKSKYFFEKKLVKRGSDWLLRQVCSSHLHHPLESVLNNYSDALKQYDHIKDFSFKLKAFKTDTWSFRWTLASIRMFQSAAFPILPFYDKRIVDLFCNIPTSLTNDRLLQIEFIKSLYPELAIIKWDQHDANLYNYKNARTKTLTYRAANKIKRILTGDKGITRNWEVFFLNPEGKKQLTSQLLTKPLTDLVPPHKINALIDQFYANPTAGNGYTISMLLTFSLFLQQIHEE